MTDFHSLDTEEREEWLRHPVTAAALSMLRELESVANAAVITQSKSVGLTLHELGLHAGKADGLNLALYQLTRMPK